MWDELDDCYSPYETYGNVTICTTKYEARIDDTPNNSGSILVHNVVCYGLIKNDLYIIDKIGNKMILNIYTRELRKVSDDAGLSEDQMKNFDAVASYEYEDLEYMYKE